MPFTDSNEDYTGILIKDTYQNVIHFGGSGSYSASLYDGTGSLVNVSWNNISQSIHGRDVIFGNIRVSSLTADSVYITEVTRSVLYDSGSTRFGDTLDDTHIITGSVFITGSLLVNGTNIQTIKVEQITLTSTDVSNEYITASNAITDESSLIVDVEGAGAQIKGVDYDISNPGQLISWESLGMSGLLEVGEVMRISYTTNQ